MNFRITGTERVAWPIPQSRGQKRTVPFVTPGAFFANVLNKPPEMF